MKRTLTILALGLAALVLAAAALADPGDRGKGAAAGHATYRFTVVTTDNGTCQTANHDAIPWANDRVVRTFTIKRNRDGSYRLTRQDRGVFSTIGGPSPGACERRSHHGKTVRAGVKGRLVGFISGTVSGGTFNPKAAPPNGGFTDTFVAAYFGSSARFSCFASSSQDCTFNFDYSAPTARKLLYRHWQDRGKGAGAKLAEEFHGDIANH